jgi:hypothetical protein
MPFDHPETLPLLLDNATRTQDKDLLSELWSEMAHYIPTERVKQILAIAKTCLNPDQIAWLENSLRTLV